MIYYIVLLNLLWSIFACVMHLKKGYPKKILIITFLFNFIVPPIALIFAMYKTWKKDNRIWFVTGYNIETRSKRT